MQLDDLRHQIGMVDSSNGLAVVRLLDVAVDHIAAQERRIARLEAQVADLQTVVVGRADEADRTQRLLADLRREYDEWKERDFKA